MSKLSRLRAITVVVAPDFISVSHRLDWTGAGFDLRHRGLDTKSREGPDAERASGSTPSRHNERDTSAPTRLPQPGRLE